MNILPKIILLAMYGSTTARGIVATQMGDLERRLNEDKIKEEQVQKEGRIKIIAKIGSAIVEPNRFYWLKEKDAWRAYTPEGFKEGSLSIGSDDDGFIRYMISEGGELHINGYGEESRKQIEEFRRGLPAMSISKNKGSGKIIDGKIAGAREYSTAIRGMREVLQSERASQLERYIEEMLADGKLDAVELYKLIVCIDERFMIDSSVTSSTKFLAEEIKVYCNQRIKGLIKAGGKESDVRYLGVLAIFNLEDAMTLNGLRNAIREQAKYNKSKIIPPPGYFLKGKLGEKNEADHMEADIHPATDSIGNIEWSSKIIKYLDSISPESVDRVGILLKDILHRAGKHFKISEEGIEVDFNGTDYKITVEPTILGIDSL